MVTRHGLTVAEYLRLPEEPPYLEYLDGEVVSKVAPDRRHSDIVVELIEALAAYRKLHGGHSAVEGRVGFEDPADTRFLLPDVSYCASGRPRGDRIMTPPPLAIEVRSTDQSLASLREKCRYYRAHGVDVAWLIDPVSRRVEVFDGAREGPVVDGEASLESPSLPGFRLALRDLFAVLDEPDI